MDVKWKRYVSRQKPFAWKYVQKVHLYSATITFLILIIKLKAYDCQNRRLVAYKILFEYAIWKDHSFQLENINLPDDFIRTLIQQISDCLIILPVQNQISVITKVLQENDSTFLV